jgi:transposase
VFVRKKKNKSGSVSVQVIDKSDGYRVVKTIGVARDPDEVARLFWQGKQFVREQKEVLQLKLFPLQSTEATAIASFIEQLSNSHIHTIGPELIFGTLFNRIGFNQIKDELFRHLVVARLAYPTSKLGTVDYLKRYQGIELKVDAIYRFLDKLAKSYQDQVEQIAYSYTKKLLKGKISVVFYDLTTLYFEAQSEDDLRRVGFSKDGKFNKPQIMLGLLVTTEGYPLGYELFAGNIFEGHTLIPAIRRLQDKFSLETPVIVADAGLLSKDNQQELTAAGYDYILGARIKNESDEIKRQILKLKLADKETAIINKTNTIRLVIGYSTKRDRKDQHNREKGLKRLEKKLKSGKLTKTHINNRGYNKYLQLKGKVDIAIDYQKFETDGKWDGLKGYLTTTNLNPQTIVKHYASLWQIEKAFRISKTDLRIRPIYHYRERRIQAHLSIAFAAYTVYKELERQLKKQQIPLSPSRAAQLTHTMYALDYTDPDTKESRQFILQMDGEQKQLYQAICQT